MKQTTIKPGNVYGFTGNKKSGKRAICEHRANFHGAIHIRFGQQLIAITKYLYTLDETHFNEVNQTKQINEECSLTPLDLLERTRVAIETYEKDENFLLKQTLNRIQSFVNKGLNVWISNVTTNNEAQILKQRFKAMIILVNRKAELSNGYQGVDKRFVDLEIENDGSLEDLYKYSNHIVTVRLNNERKALSATKAMVLNNAKQHLGDIARELLKAEILNEKQMSQCYVLTKKDGIKVCWEYKMDSNSRLDEIFRECYQKLSLLISEEIGVE